MSITFTQSVPVGVPKLGRNDPCYCGSGKKYKKCHLLNDEREQNLPFGIGMDKNPNADRAFDDLCDSFGIPLNAAALMDWNLTRATKDFDLTYFIELFAAYAPGNTELRQLINLTGQILQNHPGKPNPSIDSLDSGRFRQETFDIPDIDQNSPFGRINKALALTKIQQYLDALLLYATILPNTEEFTELFRIYLNIGVCLMQCGQTELARAYFTKSLKNNPSYDIARKNLDTFRDSELIEHQRVLGYGTLLFDTIKTLQSLDAIDLSSCDLSKDIHVFLSCIQTGHIHITEKQRMITLKCAQQINALFQHPDPDTQTVRARGKMVSWDMNNQWQYPVLSWIYIWCNQAGLLRVEKKQLKLSRIGKLFFTESDSDKLAWILKDWMTDMDWRAFLPPGWMHEMDEEMIEQIAGYVPTVISILAHTQASLTASNMVEQLKQPGLQTKQVSQKEKAQDALLTMILSSRLEHHVLDPFTWMGILTATKKRSLFSKDRTFTVTPLGRNIFDKLMRQADALIPEIVKAERVTVLPHSKM